MALLTAANYPNCLAFTLRYEGGYSHDPHDPGNYTGGKVGVGLLKGTQKGIAASSHPTLDIINLTDAQIAQIYRSEYWEAINGDALPAGVDLMGFDICVNMGAGRAKDFLQQTASLAPIARIERLDALRLGFWRRLRIWATFGRGWLARETACLKTALRMAKTGANP